MNTRISRLQQSSVQRNLDQDYVQLEASAHRGALPIITRDTCTVLSKAWKPERSATEDLSIKMKSGIDGAQIIYRITVRSALNMRGRTKTCQYLKAMHKLLKPWAKVSTSCASTEFRSYILLSTLKI